VGNVPPRSIEVISQTWYTYDYKIGINKYPGNAGEINRELYLVKSNITILMFT
jgi:hypothetical protein